MATTKKKESDSSSCINFAFFYTLIVIAIAVFSTYYQFNRNPNKGTTDDDTVDG